MTQTPDMQAKFNDYLAKRDDEHDAAIIKMWNNLDEREQLLVKEAAVMGFVLGIQQVGGSVPREEFPKDGEITARVLGAARSTSDLYPTLGALEGL